MSVGSSSFTGHNEIEAGPQHVLHAAVYPASVLASPQSLTRHGSAPPATVSAVNGHVHTLTPGRTAGLWIHPTAACAMTLRAVLGPADPHDGRLNSLLQVDRDQRGRVSPGAVMSHLE